MHVYFRNGSKTATPFNGWRGSYSPNDRREGGRPAGQRWAMRRHSHQNLHKKSRESSGL